jgi:hypothetical protein
METKRGHLGGPVEHSEGKSGESVMAILRFLYGSPRLCRLRTDGLVPVSKYWTYRSHAGDYGPSKPSSLPSTDAWLKPTTSLVGLGEKLRWVPWTTQPGWEVESGALFLGSSSIRPTLLATHERLPCTGTATESVQRAYMDWHGKHICHVGRVFPCRVYIDSNCRDSRIWVIACSWLPSSSNLPD